MTAVRYTATAPGKLIAFGMMRWRRSMTEAGTISAVRSSAGARRAWKPILTVTAANSAAVTAATIHRRRLEGAVPSGFGKRWISHSIGQPSAKPAPARGRTNSMWLVIGAIRRGTVGCPPRAGRDRDRGRRHRDHGRLVPRRGGCGGDAARARRARIGGDRAQPGTRAPARPRRARAALAGEHRRLHAPGRRARRRLLPRPRADRDAAARNAARPAHGARARAGRRASCSTRRASRRPSRPWRPGMAGGLLVDEGRRTDPAALAACAAAAPTRRAPTSAPTSR